MAEETIKISVVATGFDQVQKGLDNTSKALDNTSKSAATAGKVLGSQLNNASGQATNTLINLNRVVQDAPYGFIGIANNINPLVESFGRLKAEAALTGTTIGSQLKNALIGPAGIGIAVAAITSAITFAQIGFDRWGASAKKAKEDADDFAKGLRDAEQGALAQGLKLQALLKIVTDTTQTEEKRNIALKNANELLKEHGEKLDTINLSQQQVNDITKKYTDTLVNQAIAQKLANKIADLTIQKNENDINAKLQQAKITGLTASQTAQANKLVQVQYGRSDFAAYQYSSTVSDLSSEQKKLNEINYKSLQIQQQINDLTDQFNKKSSESNVIALNEKSTKKAGETLKQALDEFEKSLIAIQATGLSLGTPQFKINEDKIREFEGILKKIIEKFNVDPKNAIYLKLEARLQDLQFKNLGESMKNSLRKAIMDSTSDPIPNEGIIIEIPKKPFDQNAIDAAYREGLIKRFQASAKKYGIKIPSGVLSLSTEGISAQFKKIFAPLEAEAIKNAENLNNILTSTAQDIAINFGETLGAALSGQASIGDFFTGLLAQVGKGMQAFGKAMIQFAIKVEVIKQWAIANPALAIAGGIALIALGALLASQTKKQAFAVGTNYAPGGMALVGERGPEMVSLPRGARVTPAAQTAQMLGGAMQQVEVFGVLRGQDIYFSNKKYSQTYRRTT